VKSPDPRLLDRIREQVRAEKPYLVPGARRVPHKLNQNESPYDLPTPLKKELLAAFLEVPFNRYPEEQPSELVRALSRHTGHPGAGILVGNGSNELTHTLGLCFVQPGGHVVLPRPMFALFESVVRLFGGCVTAVAPLPTMAFDTDGLVAAIEARNPALTIVASPNNPTGLAMSAADIRRLANTTDGFLVVDEAYHEFNPQPSARDLLETHPNVIVLRTLSKAFGLAGLRIGYLMAHPDVVAEMLKARLPFMVNRLTDITGQTLLRHSDLIRERVASISASIRELVNDLEELPGVEVLPTDTNFVLFRCNQDAGMLLEKLADDGVLVRNMGGYPELRGYLRVNAGTPSENSAFLTALTRHL